MGDRREPGRSIKSSGGGGLGSDILTTPKNSPQRAWAGLLWERPPHSPRICPKPEGVGGRTCLGGTSCDPKPFFFNVLTQGSIY